MENNQLVDLFHNIINDSYQFAEAKERISENNQSKGIKDIWSDFHEYIKQIEKCERLTMLIPALTDAFFRKSLPLIAIPAWEMLEDNNRRMDAIRQLDSALKEDNTKEVWQMLSGKFREIMESLDFKAESDLYADITANVHVLISAFSYLEKFDFTGEDKYRRITQARKGKFSEVAPVFINTITVFRNIHDIVQAVEGSGLESLIMFAAIRKTYRDTNDYFDDWKRGYDNERKHNTMCNEHMTEEEYFEAEDTYKRKIYLVIKNGDNIWLIPSDNTNSYGTPNDDFYEYGRRKTYFPYQVLFKDFAGQPEGTTQLATINQSYKLGKMVDEEQKLFIPILFYEAKRLFFDEEPPMLDTIVIPQETTLLLTDGREVKNELAVIGSSATQTYYLQDYSVESLFADKPEVLDMIRILGIKQDDIASAPILPTKEALWVDYESKLRKHVEEAYRTVINRRLKEYADTEAETNEIYTKEYRSFTERKEEITRLLEEGRFINCSMDIVDKKYGTTTKHNSFYRGQPSEKEWYKFRKNQFVLFPDEYGAPEKRPAVCIRVRPFTKAEILLFYGWEDDRELPFLIRYRDEIVAYYGTDANKREYREHPALRQMSGCNVCIGKRYYKKHLEPYFNKKDRYEVEFDKEQNESRDLFKEKLEEKGYTVNLSYSSYSETKLVAYKKKEEKNICEKK